MAPFEIMVSESQERMLCVVEPARVDEVLALCEKWEVHGTAIGDGHRHRTASSSARRRPRRRRHAGRRARRRLPALRPRAGASPTAPLYPAPPRTLADGRPRRARRCSRCSARRTSPRGCRSSSSTTALVQSRTVRRPEQADAAVLALRERPRDRDERSTATGGSVACDPYWGTVGVVLECAANLACVGAEPLGTTNNLNFGNPEKPHIAWQLTEAVRGLGDACRALDAPIVGGNVSLYNEGAGGPDLPDAGRRHGRRAARPGARRPARASRARATPIGARGLEPDAEPRGLRAGQAARRGAARRPARRSTSRTARRVLRRSARRSARAS